MFDAESPLTPPNQDGQAHVPRGSFAGFLNQTEISQAYVAADCLVLASDHAETWGLVVNEALASGLPCLVSDACGCAEELAGALGSFGLGNVPALGSKLVDLASQGGKAIRPSTFSESASSIVRAYGDLLESSTAGCRQLIA